MATNFIQPGDTITLTAPAGGVVSGNGYVIGSLFVVALTTAAAGAQFEGRTTGVWELPKADAASGKDFAAGETVFWSTAHKADKTAATSRPIGVATAAAASTATHITVRLDGIATAVVG